MPYGKVSDACKKALIDANFDQVCGGCPDPTNTRCNKLPEAAIEACNYVPGKGGLPVYPGGEGGMEDECSFALACNTSCLDTCRSILPDGTNWKVVTGELPFDQALGHRFCQYTQ